MSWEKEAEEIKRRRAFASELGGAANVDRHHAAGRLTVRERITGVVDAGSFQEVGSLTGVATYADGALESVRPAPYVMGLGRIGERPVAVGGEDFTVRGGTSWAGAGRRKGGQGGFVEDLAYEYRIPLVNLIDGAGGSVDSLRKRGYASFPGVHGFERSVELLGRVPVVSAVLGTAAGGPAGRAILSHWSVMVKNTSQIFAAGPPVVRRSLGQSLSKEELGGSHLAVGSAGTIDNEARDEAEAFALIRRFLGYMPQNVWELPPRGPTFDPPTRADEDLLRIIPRDRRRPYDARKLVAMVADRDSLMELAPTYGAAVITLLGRLNGYVVGFVVNNPMVYGGAVDSRAARKQTRFIELCDCFNIPIVFLVDVPGFMVGRQAEAEGTLRDGMRCVYAMAQLSVPVLTVVVRKCYGMAGMATCGKNGLDLKVAWPSAEWGSLPVEGGVTAAFKREIEAADDPKAREREIEDELRALASPFRTAEVFGVEEIIDPRETRGFLCRFVEAMQGRLAATLGPKLKAGVRP